jgi:hypothetical protein
MRELILRCHPEIQSDEDLLPPGAAPGTVPTDLEQATGLERLEILGKMDGIDIFDMKPLDASRKGIMPGYSLYPTRSSWSQNRGYIMAFALELSERQGSHEAPKLMRTQ